MAIVLTCAACVLFVYGAALLTDWTEGPRGYEIEGRE